MPMRGVRAIAAACALPAAAQGPACLNTMDFAPPVFYSTGPDARSMSLGDINADGLLDVAVVNDSNGTVVVSLGVGDGTFSPEIVLAPPGDATVVHIAENPGGYSGTGVMLVGTDTNTAVFYERSGAGLYTQYICELGGDARVKALALWDFDTPAGKDIVMAVERTAAPDEVVIRLAFTPFPFADVCDKGFNVGSFDVGDGICDLAIGDFDNDGDEDLAIATKSDSDIEVFLPELPGTTIALVPAGPAPSKLAVADVNEDGFDDVVVALDGLNAVRVLRADGAGGFLGAVNVPYSLVVDGNPTDLAVADFNHDGDLDIVLATGGIPALLFFPGSGNGAFGAQVAISSQFDHSVGAVDADLDGNVDLVSSTPIGPGGPADGFQVWISECTLCPADINGDGVVAPADYTAWLACFADPMSSPFCDNADVNNDGSLSPADFTAWLDAFSDECP